MSSCHELLLSPKELIRPIGACGLRGEHRSAAIFERSKISSLEFRITHVRTYGLRGERRSGPSPGRARQDLGPAGPGQ